MPEQLAISSRRTSVPLRFTVVGGSIAGLATAYALQRTGHSVIVLEKDDGTFRSPGGLRSPPNMTRILNQWGLGPCLDKFGHKCSQFIFRQGRTGKVIGITKLHEQFLQDLLADFYFIQHGDLHSILYEHAAQEGVEFRFNSKVVQVVPETATVTLESGEQIVADVVIGADGPISLVGSTALGKKVPDTRQRNSILSFCIPIEDMQKDEELRQFAERPDQWFIWLGEECMLHGFTVNAGRTFSVTLYTHLDNTPEDNEQWKASYPLDNFNFDMTKFEPRVHKLLGMAKEVVPQTYTNTPSADGFVCDDAQVVLVGEAAHPILPSGHHSTALVIEDAQTLGSLFTEIQDRGQVPQLLEAYEELRQARCEFAQCWECRKYEMLTLPAGEEQEERDIKMGKASAYEEWERMDEQIFRSIWGDELELMAYDAREKVEDWWTKWGSLLSGGNPKRQSFAPSLQISISKDG